MTGRKLATVLGFALASSAIAQLDDAALRVKISFEGRAAMARKVIEDLSKAANVKLATSLNKETLLLRVTDVPLHEVMVRIASATNSQWQLSGGVYRLSRSVKTDKEQADAELRRVQDAVKIALDKLVAANSPQKGNAQIAIGWSATRTLPKILAKIGPKALAEMQENERIVFSTQPNRMQRPMGLTMDEYVKMVTDDYNFYRPDGSPDYKTEAFRNLIERYPFNEPTQEQGSMPIKFTIAVRRTGTGYYFSSSHYNSRGTVFMPGFTNISTYNRVTVDKLPPLEGPDAKLEISEEAAAFGIWFKKGSGAAPIPRTLLDKLTKPNVFDPYSFQVSECLLAASKCKGTNLVANIPDSMDPVFEIFQHTLPTTVNEYLQSLKTKPYISLSMENGWMTIRPTSPYAERSWYVDRNSMTKLIQNCRGGQARLWDLGDYVVANPRARFAAVDDPYQMYFCPNLFSLGERTIDLDMLRFYGSLTPTDRKQFENGATIRFSGLPQHLRQIATEIVFWGQPLINLESPEENSPGSAPALDWRSDPTELMPDGLPNRGEIQVSIAKGHALAYSLDSPAFQFGSMSPNYYGMDAWRQEDRGQDWQATRLRLGSRRAYTCKFLLAPGASISKVLTEDAFDPNEGVKSWQELPADLKSIVEREMENQRKRMHEFRNRPRPGSPVPN